MPWFPLVLRINNPGLSVTGANLYSALVAQVGNISFVNSLLNIRVFSIRVWGPIPTTNTPLVVQIRDVFDDIVGTVIPGTSNILEEITDYADQVNRAKLGYVYSTVQSQKSLLLGPVDTNPYFTVTGAGANSVAYVKLLWRPFQTGATPNVNLPVIDLSDTDSEVEVLPMVKDMRLKERKSSKTSPSQRL